MPGQAAGAFISALRDNLETTIRADNDFANDFPVWIVDEGVSALEEHVVLIRSDDEVGFNQEHAAFGRGSRDDFFTIPGQLVALATGGATTDSATFETAMTRAESLLSLIIGEIRDNPPNVGDQTLRTIVGSGGLRPARVDQGWVVICDFDIEARVRVS